MQIRKQAANIESLKNTEKQKLAVILRKLLNKTYIVREISQGDYIFCRNNFEIISSIVELFDFTLKHDPDNEIIYIRNTSLYDDEQGTKLNRKRITKRDFLIYAALVSVWYDNIDVFAINTSINVSLEDVLNKMTEEDLLEEKIPKTGIKESLNFFSKYNLLKYKETENKEIIITLYPSLVHCLQEEELREYIETIKEGALTETKEEKDEA